MNAWRRLRVLERRRPPPVGVDLRGPGWARGGGRGRPMLLELNDGPVFSTIGSSFCKNKECCIMKQTQKKGL